MVLSLLRFPLTLNGRGSASLPEGSRQILEAGETLVAGQYSTVVGMPFHTERASKEGHAKLGRLRPEVLLFAHNLGEIRLGPEDGVESLWTRDGDESFARIAERERTLGTWSIHRLEGTIPDEVRKLDKNGASTFEVTVAIPNHGHKADTPLFMFFPTEIPFPLPVVCHVTLELEQNRKHLQRNRAGNGYVLTQVAQFIAWIAEQIANSGCEDEWAGASLLIPGREFSKELVDEGLPATLLNEAKMRRILPTLSGTPMMAAEAAIASGTDGTWLPARLFPNVVPVRNEQQLRFVRSLGVAAITGPELKERISNIDLSFDERIALITELSHRHNMSVACTSALLLD